MYGHPHATAGVLGATATISTSALPFTLPFTGLSLVWWVLIAATLILVGASLLRTSHALDRIRRGDRPECVPAESREER